jgi:subtilisin-like proprotein convertase family protein
MLSALGKTYKDKSYNALTAAIKIYTPFTQQYGGGYIQDFMASGLFALASNSVLTPLGGVCDRATVYSNLNTDFGVDGTSLSTFSNKNLAFNASLTLWGLTINKNSANPLQRYMESIKTSASAASVATYSIQKTGKVKSVTLSLNQANTGSKLVKVTLISPSGRSVTVLERSVNGQLNFSDLVVGGFTNLPASGTWTLAVTGATGDRVSSYLNVQTY